MSPRILEGKLQAQGLKIAVAVARFNGFITEKLVEGALDALNRTGVAEGDVVLVKVPGSWELPVVAKALAASKKYDAVIALGAVIRGATAHFDYVAGHAASGLAAAQQETGVPVAFGVITTDTVEQAIDRAGAKAGNKGFDAAMTAVEMANLMRLIKGSKG